MDGSWEVLTERYERPGSGDGLQEVDRAWRRWGARARVGPGTVIMLFIDDVTWLVVVEAVPTMMVMVTVALSVIAAVLSVPVIVAVPSSVTSAVRVAV